MKKEIISDAMDELDEEFIAHAADVRARGGRRNRKLWVSIGAAAACLGILAISGSLLSGAGRTAGESNSQGDSGRVIQPVSIASLLRTNSGVSVENAQREMRIPLGNYQGYYEQVTSAVTERVSQSLGKGIPGADGWYEVRGHQDRQYLIYEEDEGCTLWKFLCFDSEEYSYRDVLEQVYHLYSAEQIAEYTVLPPKFDNTERGRQIQREIGTTVVDDRAMVESLYEILSTLTCYGRDHWELIDYGGGDVDVDGNGPGDKEGMRLGRYLTITTTDGNEIDGLKYTAVSDCFYEFCGIAYRRLAEEQAGRAWDIIGAVSDGADQETDDGGSGQDERGTVLVEAANKAAQEEINELQDRISQGMMSGELSGVVVSAVKEEAGGCYIEITVTDNASELIDALCSLDTLGGVLEIIYAPDVRISLD